MNETDVKITMTIAGNVYTYEEAEQVYKALKKIFEPNAQVLNYQPGVRDMSQYTAAYH